MCQVADQHLASLQAAESTCAAAALPRPPSQRTHASPHLHAAVLHCQLLQALRHSSQQSRQVSLAHAALGLGREGSGGNQEEADVAV